MMMEKELKALLKRYVDGECTTQEKARLERWFDKRSAEGSWDWGSEEERLLVQQVMHSRIKEQLFASKTRVWFTFGRIGVAAAIFLMCCSVAIWLYVMRQAADPLEIFYTQHAVEPGSETALLTLSDGSTINLGDVASGTLFDHNGLAIKKMEGGGLQYEVNPENHAGLESLENKISIPRGAQYQLVLPDGTKVWINSATTLVYPQVFVGKERRVELRGEAYFEVAKNETKPFRVIAGGTEVAVTGTQFNVTAYPEERKVVTSLVEGGVRVAKENHSAALIPGQQAITTNESDNISIKKVDMDYALAWLHGDFLFEDQDIRAIMYTIARWYNVDVTYIGEPNPTALGGTYTRSKGLEELLKHLESLSGMRFKFDVGERRVTVMN